MKVADDGEIAFDNDTSSTLDPLEEDSPSAQQRTTQRSWGDSAKSSLLWLSVLTSLLVVAAGICLLGFVITARSFAPSVSQLTKELYFDYSENTAVASASFREDAVMKVVKQAKNGQARVFPPGQQMNVWLELEAAEAHGNVNTDIFQVVAQLLTAEGKSAATASRPGLVPHYWVLHRWVRNLMALPLVMAGWLSENEVVKVPLFSRYVDQPSKPFTGFRVVLKAVGKSGNLPHLYSARVHVDLILGYFTSLLYWVRPGWSLLPAVALALSLMGGGSLAAFISFLVLAGSGQKSHAPPHSPPQSDVDVESEQGAKNSSARSSFELVEASQEPLPRTGTPGKASALETAEELSTDPAETILKAQEDSASSLQRRRPQKQLEAG